MRNKKMLKLCVAVHALCSYLKHFTLIQIVLIRTQKHEYDILYEVFCYYHAFLSL